MPMRPPQHRPAWHKPIDESERQRKREYDRNRPSSTDRGYDVAWRKLRAVFIKQHPVCQRVGCNAASIDADHILSVRDHPELRLEWSNLRALCRSHHSERTAREQGFARRKS
ncbi:MAG TPA: HNH endonuclease signature motif containing protein [Reyranella sp.]|nr:HNH endonuclease signature motif containing protein [Reyranella sp.]HTE82914.1 HNH endonuclease signature motif containing protein [Reyranella sp.]